MKELQFVARRQADWELWDRWLGLGSEGGPEPGAAQMPPPAAGSSGKARKVTTPKADPSAIPVGELPSRFRALSHDLSLARDRNYSSALVDRLQHRVLIAHQRMYGSRKRFAGAALNFLVRGLPERVRSEWRVIGASALLFFGPLIGMIILLQWVPDAVYFFMSGAQVSDFEGMYAPGGNHVGRPRGVGDDWGMFAHYVGNNVRIDFQCFAGGITFGIGAVFFLLFNGFTIGAVAGYLTHLGFIETFWGFVAGHSSLELTGAVLSGAAGLKIGLALIAPGTMTRGTALRVHARSAVELLYGAALMTFGAAFIEAFWSPRTLIAVHVKYGVGIGLWLLLLSYLLFAGRRGGLAEARS